MLMMDFLSKLETVFLESSYVNQGRVNRLISDNILIDPGFSNQ